MKQKSGNTVIMNLAEVFEPALDVPQSVALVDITLESKGSIPNRFGVVVAIERPHRTSFGQIRFLMNSAPVVKIPKPMSIDASWLGIEQLPLKTFWGLFSRMKRNERLLEFFTERGCIVKVDRYDAITSALVDVDYNFMGRLLVKSFDFLSRPINLMDLN